MTVCDLKVGHMPHEDCPGMQWVRRSVPEASSITDEWYLSPLAEPRRSVWGGVLLAVLIGLTVTALVLLAFGIAIVAGRPSPASGPVPMQTPQRAASVGARR